MGQRCNDSVGRLAGTVSQSSLGPTRRVLSGLGPKLAGWSPEGRRRLMKFGKKFHGNAKAAGRPAALFEAGIKPGRSQELAKAWLEGPDAYQAGQAQIGGLTKGGFFGSDRVGMAACGTRGGSRGGSWVLPSGQATLPEPVKVKVKLMP